MSCLFILMALFVPRFTIFFIWILTNWIERTYVSFIWPFLGFFFMPYTTLAYMAGQLNGGITDSSFYMLLFIIAIIVDVFGWGEKINGTGEDDENSIHC